MKRVVLFRNGSGVDGKVVLVTHSLEELLVEASQKLGVFATLLFTPQGGHINDLRLIRDDDILYVSEGEDFRPPAKPSPGMRPAGCVGTRAMATPSPVPASPTTAGSPGQGGAEGREWVTLNVGGRLFTTTHATLVTKEPNSMLAKMFTLGGESLVPSCRDAHGAFLIDRSYTYFEPILNYLRNGTLILDPGINPEGVLEEARFFGIEGAIPELEAVVAMKESNREMEPLKRRHVVEALITTHHRDELRFQGVSLRGADLSKLDLRNINFKFADLSGCNLSGANMNGCCLERANLCGATLEGAQLLNVKLLCANMEGANLRACNFEDPAGTRSNCEGVNLRGAVLEGSMLAGVNFRVATLKNANLKNCDLRAAVLAGADLENCDLSGSDLQEANLRGANLKDTAFELMLTPLHMSQTMTCDL
ncbi:BTB/POZ domain-containing protein KCTD9 [Portunus trituberculatus]|uniref:BTB/POZ domain-containing protein KCTD9 n=1 Tax=Portunus trituberculatus TaxID=210409 RepID=A0A5B7E100_PORTR|nr:BTB/POZ domain-containing protein KCTD9 [Portunus trituberculatus]